MRLREISIRFIRYIITAYALFVALWFLSNQLIQDSWWGLVVLDKFAEYFILPAGLIFILSLFTKNKLVILRAVIPVLIFLFFYSSFFFPISTSKKYNEEKHLRVATYNIWNHNKAISLVVNVINGTNADVITLQEITEQQRDELILGLQSTYPYYHISKPVYGGTTAMFSKYPLVDIKELDIQIDRPSIIANIVINKQTLTVISAHLNPSFWAYWRQPWQKIPSNYHQYIKDQNAQVIAIQSELVNRGNVDAVIMACDCNSQETASTNRILSKTFKDAFRTIGWQLGDPGSPNVRYERNLRHIDYSWYNGDVTPMAIYRGTQSAGSDHEPVITDYLIGNVSSSAIDQ